MKLHPELTKHDEQIIIALISLFKLNNFNYKEATDDNGYTYGIIWIDEMYEELYQKILELDVT